MFFFKFDMCSIFRSMEFQNKEKPDKRHFHLLQPWQNYDHLQSKYKKIQM